MTTFVTACRAAGNVILLASAPGGNGSAATWAGYLTALREIAADLGCGLINMQGRWGAYSVSNPAPYSLWKDPDHPSNTGYWDMGQALADSLRLAVR
jgi:lysophospholipase L1-like esterase